MKKNYGITFFKKNRTGFLVCLILLLTHFSFAQQFSRARVVSLFNNTNISYGGDNEEILIVAKKADATSAVVGGYSNSAISGNKTKPNKGGWDYWLVQANSPGFNTINWQANFGGTGDDYLTDIIRTQDGGYLAGGYSNSPAGNDKTADTKGQTDYWIIKTNSNGVKQWDKDFGGNSYDYLTGLQQTADKGYILAGYTSSQAGGDRTDSLKGIQNFWVVKIDSNGSKQWDRLYGSSGLDYCTHAVVLPNGYVFSGYTYGTGGDVTQAGQGGADYWMIKTDLSGNKLWDKRFGSNDDDFGNYFTPVPSGGFLLGGTSKGNSGGDKSQNSLGGQDFWIVKTDTGGNKIWDKTFGGAADDNLNGNVSATLDGGFLLSGVSASDTGKYKFEMNVGAKQMWMLKTDSLGNYQWDKTVLTNGNDNKGYALQWNDSTYYMAGYTNASFIELIPFKTFNSSYDYVFVPYHVWKKITTLSYSLSDTLICPNTSIAFSWSSNTGVSSYGLEYYNAKNSYGNGSVDYVNFYRGQGTTSGRDVPTPGTYNLLFIARNPLGDDTILIKNAFVVRGLTCSGFTLKNDTLFASNIYPGLHYQWNKGHTLAVPGATNTFYVPKNSGTYTLCVSDSIGCRCCTSGFVTLSNGSAILNGVNDRISICSDSCLTFSLLTSPQPDSIGWHFPYTATPNSNKLNPTVCFRNSSYGYDSTFYDVEVFLHYGKQVDTLVFSDIINVYGIPFGGGLYDYDGDSLKPYKLAVYFAGIDLQWTLNGIVIPGATNLAIHPNAPGTYNLRMATMHGCVGYFGDYTLYVPKADFTSNIGVICDSGCIRFVDLSTRYPTSWKWYFAGATPNTSTDQNPQNICYGKPGSYDVTLISTSETGSDTLAVKKYITIKTESVAGVIMANPDTVCEGKSSALTLTGFNGTLQWQSSADGQLFTNVKNDTLPAYNTQALFQNQYYRVISSGCGTDTSLIKKLIVSPLPEAGTIISSRDTICFDSGVTSHLTGNSSKGSLQWQSSISGVNFLNIPFADSIVYTTPSLLPQTTYYRLIAGNGCGFDSSNVLPVHIMPQPVAHFNYIVNGTKVTFNSDSSSSDVVTYSWDFGDSTALSTQNNPTHIFTRSDTFNVCLTVYNGSNCSYTLCKDLVIINTGIDNIEVHSSIQLYPNPANESINLVVNGLTGNYELKIYNVLGQQVRGIHESPLQNGQTIPIPLANLPVGTYQLVLSNGKQLFAKSFVCAK